MKSNKIFSIALSVFVSFVFIFAVTFAATTISTNINTGGTLTVSDTSTLTGAVTLGTDLTVTSGTRVGTGSTGDHITALADDTLFLEGQSEFDGIAWFDGSLRASTTLMATGAATLYSTLDVSGKTTLGNASSTILTVSGNTYLATTTLSSGGSLTLGTLASDPSGTNGQMYYSTGSGAIRVYQGSSWTTLGAANGWTDGGATVYPTAMADQFLIGTTSVSGLSQLTVEATSTAGIPLTLRGYTGQTADLFRLHNSSGTELFAIDASGNASTTMISTTGNMWVGGFATTTGSNGNFATLGTLVGSSTLQVTGAATLYSTLNVTGVTTLVNASSTNESVSGNLWVGGNATTTSAGAFSVNGLATFFGGATTTTLTLLNGEIISNATDGVIQLGGVASTTSLTLLNGETITNATDGTIAIGAAITDIVKIVGTASTSALKVGDEPAAPTINGLVFGYCMTANIASGFTASTTAYVDCTTNPTGALLAGDRVFVQATSSLPGNFVVQAASSTGVSTINLRILNTGLDGVAVTLLAPTAINFWAVR